MRKNTKGPQFLTRMY